MKRKNWFMICLITVLYVGLFIFSVRYEQEETETEMMTDVSRLMPVKVDQIVQGDEEKIVDVVQNAIKDDKQVSIAGTRHSMGGHTYYDDAIVLDMTNYDQILDFDREQKTITVESGATWADIQEHINPHGLSIKVMQSQNIFTIGGSLSANAHGRDIRYGSLIDTVKSFRLLTADGEVINVSRSENEELFSLVIGGYGLFGVILDIELELTDDELYKKENSKLDYEEYPEFVRQKVLDNPDVRMHLARLSTATDSFLEDMYVENYVLTDENGKSIEEHNELKGEELTGVQKFGLGLARHADWGKNLFWSAQNEYYASQDSSLITRNNVMRPDSDFLEYENEKDTDVLQEYFVPVENFPRYIDGLREILTEEELNLFNITVRYTQKSEEAALSYAQDDMLALVLLINQGLSAEEKEKTERVVQKMIDVTHDNGGTYYLPYMPYPTREQMRESYPRTNEFFEKKLQYDSQERFTNLFYERYK